MQMFIPLRRRTDPLTTDPVSPSPEQISFIFRNPTCPGARVYSVTGTILPSRFCLSQRPCHDGVAERGADELPASCYVNSCVRLAVLALCAQSSVPMGSHMFRNPASLFHRSQKESNRKHARKDIAWQHNGT